MLKKRNIIFNTVENSDEFLNLTNEQIVKAELKDIFDQPLSLSLHLQKMYLLIQQMSMPT